MAETLKIAASSWTDLGDPSLDTMSTSAALVISNASDYPLLVTEATALTNAANTFHLAHSRYQQFGGNGFRDKKDADKIALYEVHLAVAKKLEETSNGNVEYLTRPGYRLDEKGGTISIARVPPPRIQKAESVKVRGRVKFILSAANSREIKGVIGRYSEDNGATWIEGQIVEFGLNFTLEGQASGKAVLYQFMFKATNGRESDWSDIVRVEVF
jgi:hypothetical protein